MLNLLIASHPEPLVVPLDSFQLAPTPATSVLRKLFSESPGRQAAIDRLFGVFLIRSAMKAHLDESRVLMGLSDSRLDFPFG